MALALVSFAVISSALRLLHGNVVLLRRILRQFDYWLATGYALAAAASGSVALADDLELAALWSLSQLLLPLVLLYDALPFAADSLGKAHRLVFFPAYLFFCLACLGMLHSGHFLARGASAPRRAVSQHISCFRPSRCDISTASLAAAMSCSLSAACAEGACL